MTLPGEGGAHASHGQHGGGHGAPKTLSLRDGACVAKKCENREGGRLQAYQAPGELTTEPQS